MKKKGRSPNSTNKYLVFSISHGFFRLIVTKYIYFSIVNLPVITTLRPAAK